MIKITAVLIVGLIFCNTGLSQNGSITGVVSDEFGILPGARVELIGADNKTNTDIKGAYSFMVGHGKYTVRASYLMYETKEVEVEVSTNSINPIINIELKPGSSADEDVFIGSRFSPRSQLESPVSIDIISNEEIISSAQLTLSQLLMYSIPSFNSNRQTIGDGTDHIAPSTIRGLGSDQFLVLINGKRRHSSSLVNVNGTIGRGSVSTDLDAIPISSIDHVEIMRDGAGAQYGSDAIAGVINIVLKEQVNAFSLVTAYQPTFKSGGTEQFFGVNYGTGSSYKGFVNFTAEIRRRASLNRSSAYLGNVYSDNDSIDKVLIEENNFFGKTGYSDKRVMEVGAASAFDAAMFMNVVVPTSQKSMFYVTGGFNYRKGESKAFYRFPKDEAIVVRELHPNGFSPEIHTDIFDRSATVGVRGEKRGWYIDLSSTFGNNTFDYTVRNSNNASMGIASPKDFHAGGFNYGHNTTNLDFSRGLKNSLFMHKIDMAFGSEFRAETYSIIAGDEESWIDGGDTLSDGTPRAIGSQGFIGFRNNDELSKRRSSGAIYGDVEWYIFNNLLLETAVRYGIFSDFGTNTSWKFAGRYEMDKKYSVRMAYSTSFRAPSLQQIYFNNLSTQFIDGVPAQVGTFNNQSAMAEAFGIERLKAETSKNVSAGFTGKPLENFTINVDFFFIDLMDRIVLSGRFSDGYEMILSPLGAGAAQFFTNAISTKTSGFDISASYNWVTNKGLIRLFGGFNYARTVVSDSIQGSDMMTKNAEIIFNREEIARLEVGQPINKGFLRGSYSYNKWSFDVRETLFGKIKYVHPDDGDKSNWVLNEYSGKVESRDDTFSAKLITDLNITFHVNERIAFSIGGNNVFNVLPDKHKHSANVYNGLFPYSRRVQQFGTRGAMYYVRARLTL
ncbi:MAG: TonB-dependent receptor [Crocinitomicaceae bacterium]|nr:TonB-dependent receptor [Crocinitomicaceae bacterium]